MRESWLFWSHGLEDAANIRSSIEGHEHLLKAIYLRGTELARILMGHGTLQRFQTSRTDLKLVEGCPDHLV